MEQNNNSAAENPSMKFKTVNTKSAESIIRNYNTVYAKNLAMLTKLSCCAEILLEGLQTRKSKDKIENSSKIQVSSDRINQTHYTQKCTRCPVC